MKLAAIFLVTLASSGAGATGYYDHSTNMRIVDGNPNSSAAKYQFDQNMIIYEPVCAGTLPYCSLVWQQKNLLIVFLHGHAATSGPDGNDFLQLAAQLGYHGVSFDYDYGDDANLVRPVPPNQTNGPRYVCGCYTDCYDQFHGLILNGTAHLGLPDSLYPLKSRIKKVIGYLSGLRDASGGDWGQYLDGSGNIEWSQVVLVGFSRGSSLATVLAKNNTVHRLLTFSGDHDQLRNGSAAQTNGTSTNIRTTYHYGDANHLGDCQYPGNNADFSPAYINEVSAADGWSTLLPAMYTMSNVDDTVAPYFDSTYSYGTEVNLTNLGFGLGTNVGNDVFGEWNGWDSSSPHWLVSAAILGVGPGDICGNASNPHDSVMADGPCINSAATALRQKVWQYMLTN